MTRHGWMPFYTPSIRIESREKIEIMNELKIPEESTIEKKPALKKEL